ncbi:hypothetical protein EJ110_NYTH27410 [Nymphaea thermarum]|nr:hypothetical protein EJ110_NYTH27410 [Nymphaea thermarum]
MGVDGQLAPSPSPLAKAGEFFPDYTDPSRREDDGVSADLIGEPIKAARDTAADGISTLPETDEPGPVSRESNKHEDDGGSPNHQGESGTAISTNLRKNGSPKENARSIVYAINKSTSQIKKPPHRKNASPLNWFPRKKTTSFLERKIKQLQALRTISRQELGGMDATLDETLGHSNPHYSKVEREKIAARAAASRVMEARKTAMVEASWCRILHAARINSKEAEQLLAKAERNVEEAFKAASSLGVVMYNKAGSPRRPWVVETSSSKNGGSTHTVTASFETAFEVDKEVAAAVKSALIRLASLPQFLSEDKDNVSGDLHQISQDLDECESQTDVASHTGAHSSELVNMMLERLRVLTGEELASLATIVATCGLNAILEVKDTKQRHATEGEKYNLLGGLESCLVKHVSRLEREVQEAKMNMKDNAKDTKGPTEKTNSNVVVPSLESILRKHSSRLEKEIEVAKKSEAHKRDGKIGVNERPDKENVDANKPRGEVDDNGLDKVLVKRVHRLEKDKIQSLASDRYSMTRRLPRKPQGSESSEVDSLDKVLVKHVSRLERDKVAFCASEEASRVKSSKNKCESNEKSLGEVLVKHLSRIEREKFEAAQQVQAETLSESKSRSPPATKESPGFETWHNKSYRALREERMREMQQAWGGLSLGNSVRPHLSRLERDKAAWSQAEEEARKRETIEARGL